LTSFSKTSAPRIAVLIAYADCTPFREIVEETHRFIWKDAEDQGIDVFYISGRPIGSWVWKLNSVLEHLRWSRFFPVLYIWDKLSFRRFRRQLPQVLRFGNSLEVQVPSGLRFLGITILAGFKLLSDMGYTHMYKTTVSSVVNLKDLTQLALSHRPGELLYAGTVNDEADFKFVSGANLFINREVADFLFQNRHLWRHEFLDDVAIGRLLSQEVTIKKLSSLNFTSVEKLRATPTEELMSVTHFRCKSDNRPEGDIQILRELITRMQSTSNTQ